MTRDDIIRMAQEAGLHLATDVNWMPIIGLEYAEKFVAIAYAAGATAERAACVKIIMEDVDSYDEEAYNALRARAFAILERGQE